MLYVHYTGCKFTNKFAARQSFMCFFSEIVGWGEERTVDELTS